MKNEFGPLSVKEPAYFFNVTVQFILYVGKPDFIQNNCIILEHPSTLYILFFNIILILVCLPFFQIEHFYFIVYLDKFDIHCGQR